MPQMRDPKTGRYISGGGSSVGGAASTNPRIQKAAAVGNGATAGGGSIVNEDANPEYRYHSTSYQAFSDIKYDGLKPSTRGQLGKGVYLSKDVEGTKGWTSEDKEQVNLRVKTSTLKKNYDLDEWEDQSLAHKRISADDIEVKTKDGVWLPVSKAYVGTTAGRKSIGKITW